jgi:hypothetical protein
MPCTDRKGVFMICIENGVDQGCTRFENRRCTWVKNDRSRCFNVLSDNANGADGVNKGEDARRGQDACPETCFNRDRNCPQPPPPAGSGPINGRVSVSTTVKPSTISNSNPSQKPTNGRVPFVSITAEPTAKQTQRPVSSLSITAEPTAK